MNRTTSRRLRALAVLLGLASAGPWAAGAPADIAQAPLAAQTSGTVRPNLMFILDDSGSMNDEHLPESADVGNVCFGHAGTNRIFFDPAQAYPPPLRANGSAYPNASFGAAYADGYRESGTTVNLGVVANLTTPTVVVASTSVSGAPTTSSSSYTCRTGQASCDVPAPNPVVTTTTTDDVTTTRSRRYERSNAPGLTCSSQRNSCLMTVTTTTTVTTATNTRSKFYWATPKAGASADCNAANYDIRYDPDALSADEKQRYANWYSYYRKRMYAMRAGAGRAFAALDATRFRVGFSTISSSGASDGSRFLNVRDFDAGTQKADFFSRLYGAAPSGYTPLRPALEKAGRYYANKVGGQNDPVQYSCQKNYTILSTDGYWNTADEPSGYAPRRLGSSSAIGNQDGGSATPRPQRDECDPTSDGNGCKAQSGGGVGNTLADIALYFRKSDLRDPSLNNCSGAVANQDVCVDKPDDGNAATYEGQHMVTYTIGLGVSGLLNYRPDYDTATSGDFWDLRQGTRRWPNPVTSSGASLYDDNSVTARIDDLWHAAVNGGGRYFSANNAQSLANSLLSAFTGIDSDPRGGSAAATSSLRPTNGDDWLFFSQYRPGLWEGELKAYKIDLATGAVLDPAAPVWQASTRIKNQPARSIYFRKAGQPADLAPFRYAELPAAARASFDNLCQSGSEKLTQCASLSATARAKVTGDNVVDYLRGVATYELGAAQSDDQLFRSRATPLGDVVNAAPAYVKKSPFQYRDAGHAAYAAATASRQAVVYVAANDGMLHAINVGSGSGDPSGGTELWAYVPTMVMGGLHKLADRNYETMHRYSVDGSPVVGDVYDAAAGGWRTILVGGLNAGGRGYYALDVTDPLAPRSLWELSSADDADIGFSYGNPVIAKTKSGRWIVAFSSGVNNVGPGSGGGFLFVRDALSGAAVSKLATGAGSPATPSNLGKLNAWVDADTDNVAQRIYGADMLGNVWRFDFDDNIAPAGNEAFLLARTGSAQPITAKPSLSEIVVGASKLAVVAVGTGRYLGERDLGDSSLQSLYLFKDELSATSLGELRTHPAMVEQTLDAARRVAAPLPVDWSRHAGWFVDFDRSAGERVHIDMQQQYQQLAVATNVPSPTPCTPGGSSWLYYFDLQGGKVLLTYASEALTVGITTVELPNGKSITYQQSANEVAPTPRQDPDRAALVPGALRRVSWRELVH